MRMPPIPFARVRNSRRPPRRRFRRAVLARAVACALGGGMLWALSAAPAMGALAYWDTNGTTVGAVNQAGTPANGIWGVNAFWNPLADGTGTPVGWNSGDTAVFAAGTNAS